MLKRFLMSHFLMKKNNGDPVIVRLPPSPTGFLHIGNVRTLLFNYLFAKKHGGKIVLRSEDTDKERSKLEYEEYMKEALTWLGITWDEFYRQSDRTEIYQEYIQKLINEDKAYISEEVPTEEQKKRAEEEGRKLRTSVVRFRNSGESVTFLDEVLGEITVDTTDLGDFVIAKDLNTPLYHLTVVVDDFLMGVTHIIRGNDHVANTPRHILLQKAIGAPRPAYVHLPLIIGKDGKKLSKRHGNTATLDYRDELGVLPEAMVNFLAFLGWNPGDEREILTTEELIKEFTLSRIQKGQAVFNEEKLRWINKEHLNMLSDNDYKDIAKPFLLHLSEYNLRPILPIIRERTQVLGDLRSDIRAGEYDYAFKSPDYPDPNKIIWKKSTLEKTKENLAGVKVLLENYPRDWTSISDLKNHVWDYVEEKGRGDVLWPLRFVLSGREKSPDPFTLLSILGKEESLVRIEKALSVLI